MFDPGENVFVPAEEMIGYLYDYDKNNQDKPTGSRGGIDNSDTSGPTDIFDRLIKTSSPLFWGSIVVTFLGYLGRFIYLPVIAD